MALGEQNDFEMHSGDDRVLQITVKDVNGAVVNLTSGTVKWQLSKLDTAATVPAPKSSTPIISKTEIAGAPIVDAVNGRINVNLLPADTAALSGVYYHELEVIVGGLKSTVLFGQVTIYRDLIQ